MLGRRGVLVGRGGEGVLVVGGGGGGLFLVLLLGEGGGEEVVVGFGGRDEAISGWCPFLSSLSLSSF